MFSRRAPAHSSIPGTPEAAAERLRAFPWPPALLAALDRLSEGGHRAVLVGGTVRDALLGLEGDALFDVGTDVRPDEVIRRFPRVEPVGIEHGTVLVLAEGVRLECTTFRREGAYPDARHPESVVFTDDLRADLARRDLTVNALAYDPRGGEFTDPFGGLDDLARGVLRAVGDPRERFHEDALRPVRLARFAAALGMTPEPATRAAMGEVRARAARVAVERVRIEFEKLMRADRPSIGWDLLRECGLLELWMPELTRGYGVTQNRFHAWDVWDHGLRVCDAAPAAKPAVRWAALLHDIGKVDTRVMRDGDWTFYQHERVGAEQADGLLERLRFPNDLRAEIVHLILHHMFHYQPEWSDGAVRRWLRQVGVEHVADLFDLRIADTLGNGLRAGFPAVLEEFRERIEVLLREEQALQVRDLAVGGEDVMEVFGVGPGRAVGEALDALLEEVLDRPELNTREALRARLAVMRASRAERASGP